MGIDEQPSLIAGGSRRQRFRWGRGFLRLWVLLAALWIAVSLVLSWDQLQQARLNYAIRDDYILASPNCPGTLEKANETERLVGPDALQSYFRSLTDKELRCIKQEADSFHNKGVEQFAYFLGLLFLPPLALLAIGIATSWVLRGFTPQRLG